MKIFLDMDGVLVDFVGGVSVAHNRHNPYDNPANHGNYFMHEVWGMSWDEFAEPLHDETFWYTLLPTSEFPFLAHETAPYVGINQVFLLSSSLGNPFAAQGKMKWVRANAPQFLRNTILSDQKHILASPNTVLIDDHDSHCNAFRAEGGHAILMPRPWNSRHEDAHRSMEVVWKELAAFL